ncbi:MAG: GFA family protein [Alphaproteobacteria bacterium]|nr:GFA family protein [Alphaproteobacteria bacterium]
MAETKSHSGGCHCGGVRFDANVDLTKVISCNCSICMKRGAIFSFIPASDFTLQSGEDHLQDYQFAQKKIHHLFCSTCGVSAFARGSAPDGSEVVALNVRCLDDIDLEALSPAPFDGKSL